jgi:hypothetical protein
MTTLRESIEQRRMAEPRIVRCYELANEPVRSLQIHLGNSEKLLLPWSRFHSAGHRSAGENEELTLMFARHEVVLRGVRLALLMPKIASLHLACVWSESVEFQAKANNKEAFISGVSVCCLGNLAGANPGIILKNSGIIQDNAAE